MTEESRKGHGDSQGSNDVKEDENEATSTRHIDRFAKNSRRRGGQRDFIEEWSHRNLLDRRKDHSKIELYDDIFLKDGHLRVGIEVGMEPSRGNRKSSVWEHKGHVLWQHQAQRQREAVQQLRQGRENHHPAEEEMHQTILSPSSNTLSLPISLSLDTSIQSFVVIVITRSPFETNNL
ncbi:hypothetical protein CRE_15226 [Caenorhabditis remanei]|uniref:Uncharacterized protein n=1 Tax=Caenorhabditis remanei TaxID=31234 RepID=E3NTW9_CAERE|nr:hypothetical protein CRE_15226 [Caenorhabditis remanei]